jgi:hypothetical protein
MRLLPLLLFLRLPQESPYLIKDLDAGRKVDYLVVAAKGLAGDCDALLAHREKGGYRVGLVTYEAAVGEKPGADALAAFLKKAREEWGTSYVLLVGDARGEAGFAIPMREEEGGYFSEKFMSEKELATDFAYAALGGEEPALHVGRFPADTKDELATMIAKTIAYETSMKPGPWQRRIAFITGEAGFDPMVDRMIEAQFTKIVSENIPACYDIEVAYAQTASKYSPYPPRFNENALRMLNEGALFYVYVGHGSRDGCDTIVWQKKGYPILEAKNAKEVDVKAGLPVMVVIACSTGFVDARSGDCLGEDFLRVKNGPVAFLGGSRVTQPYGNALLGKELVASVFASERRTLGAAISEAKRRILAADDSAFRRTADAMAGQIQGKDALEPMRKDVVRHYNLLGDPALVLQRPPDDLKVETLGIEEAGKKLTAKAKAPFAEGKAIVTFECARDKFTKEIPRIPSPSKPEYEEKITERYWLANEKAFTRMEVAVKEGGIEAEFTLPEKLPAGTYYVKVFAWSEKAPAAAGAAAVKIE